MDADLLRRRRRQLGMTQTDLAAVLGVPQQTVSRWETGRHAIEHPRMLALAIEAVAGRVRWIEICEGMASGQETRRDEDG